MRGRGEGAQWAPSSRRRGRQGIGAEAEVSAPQGARLEPAGAVGELVEAGERGEGGAGGGVRRIVQPKISATGRKHGARGRAHAPANGAKVDFSHLGAGTHSEASCAAAAFPASLPPASERALGEEGREFTLPSTGDCARSKWSPADLWNGSVADHLERGTKMGAATGVSGGAEIIASGELYRFSARRTWNRRGAARLLAMDRPLPLRKSEAGALISPRNALCPAETIS